MDEHLLEKLADEHIKFLRSPTWALMRFRYREYQERLRGYIAANIRNKDFYTVSAIQGKIDDIDELIKLTERLDKDIMGKTFDVDAALHVIEKKVE